MPWISRSIAALALVVVLWASVTAWGAVVHGHPAYAVWLSLTAAAALASLAWSLRSRPERRGWWLVLRIVGMAAALGWVATTAWLRPFTATEPALSAMQSDDAVTVTETATAITLEPVGGASGVGVVFYPGARVDPRAYASHLAPLARDGREVIIVKEPLGIAFLSLGTLARVEAGDGAWAAAGHSLGGTVAALEAESADAPALVFWASYPAGDMTGYAGAVLSVSGSEDGLSTPAKIDASRADLPASTVFHQVDGAGHAQFGSYGPQPGDGTPSLTDQDARLAISETTRTWLEEVDAR